MSPRWVVLVVSLLAAVVGCRRHHTYSSHSSTVSPIDPAPVAVGTFVFPHRPEGCPYVLPAVTPENPRLVPHALRAGRAPRPANLHLTFVGDPARTVVVQWNTDDATLASEVRYGEIGAPLDRVAHGYSFVYGGARGRREHEVHLCDLSPGRRYHYVAGGGGNDAPEYSFVTAPDGPQAIRVAVAGDARTDPQTWGRVAAGAMSERPDLLLFTGDAVVDGANQARWDEFFAYGAELLASVPSLWTDGNHEGISAVYFALFAFPDNGEPRVREHFYRLDYGPMRVIVLNDTTLSDTEIRGEERDFLRNALQSTDRSRTPWTVAVHHQSIYTTSDAHGSDHLTRAAWAPIFDQYHLDFDLAGHVHCYESTLPISAGTVTDAAHGTIYLTFGGGGAPLYHFNPAQPWDRMRESTHGFAIMSMNATSMNWVAHRIDGSVIESFDVAR